MHNQIWNLVLIINMMIKISINNHYYLMINKKIYIKIINKNKKKY